jgi:hypothetical protein
MKEALLLVLLEVFSVGAFFQSLPSKATETPIQRTNLVVRWEAPKHPWPKTLWIYQAVPTKWSPMVISNLIVIGSFTDKDELTTYGTNGMLFTNSGRILTISRFGEIRYTTPDKGKASGKNVPGTNQLFQVAVRLLPKLGISLSDIAKGEDGKPEIRYVNDLGSSYVENHVFIHNITGREVRFNRSLDGIICRGWDTGGHGDFDFGDNGQIDKIWLYWSTLERDKSYSSVIPAAIIKLIREGKAVPHGMLGSLGEEAIDWPAVKSLTIKTAKPFYSGESYHGERAQRPFFPSWLRPYATLQGTADIGTTNKGFWIDCPIIDESKPLEAKDSVPHPK